MTTVEPTQRMPTWMERPGLRTSVIVSRRGSSVQFTRLADLVVSEFEVEPFVLDLIPLLDGTRTRAELLASLATPHGVSAGSLEGVLDVLAGEKLLARADPDERLPARFASQSVFLQDLIASHDALPSSVVDLQSRIGRARVVVVGAGGAGSWVLQSLAMMGVGSFTVVDPDVVETSNLNRQVLYSLEDVRRPKAETASERLRDIDPEIRVEAVRRRVTRPDHLEDVVAHADVVINCADEPSVTEASDVVAAAAQAAGVPHIVGGAYGANLGAPGTSVVPGKTTCWRCLRAATRSDHGGDDWVPIVGQGSASGTLAPLAGLVGNLIAWEASRMLLGLPLALAGRIRELDLMSLKWRDREVPPRPECGCVTVNR
jgi:molybdopterin/thiamine biosynthesis adenylyltransferase